MPHIDQITDQARDYMPEEDLSLLRKAYDYVAQIHAGQKRPTGEPYLDHLLAVTRILVSMRLDLSTLLAGLLHGALKIPDPPRSAKELEAEYGRDVVAIVRGTTRITMVNFNSKLAYQAENVRKMLLAMSKDIRVLLVKLADVLHDMRTLRGFDTERQLDLARETMDLYAPLASRLGIEWMKRELEDLAFAALHPAEHEELSAKVENSSLDRQAYVEAVKELLSSKLREHGITEFRITGRPKHLYSIYKKLIAQNIPLEKVYDKVAFRIILQNVRECYEVLGLVHALWRPVDGRFKDFISAPKANGYQSLHTSVVGPYGEFMEVQIRTEEMDEIAKEGIAAHWAYKEGTSITRRDAKLFQWLKQLIQWLQELKDPGEFLEAVRDELHDSQVYVLTPTGEVKEIAQGSTPLDFAYAIHTEVGNHCAGAKVNGRIVPLRYKLRNGDLVEIITSPGQRPNRGWLAMVRTSRARSRIRQWLRREEQEKFLEIGREVCERELRKHNLALKKLIKTGHLREILKAFSCNSLDELLRKVGSGKISVQALVRELHPPEPVESQAEEVTAPTVLEPVIKKRPSKPGKGGVVVIDGISDLMANISQCCMPVPGDEIMGYITAGRGVSVHKAACPNLQATDPERRIPVRWSGQAQAVHRAQLQITAQNRKGLIAALSNTITADDANILNMEANASGSNLARINLVLEVTGLEHLTRLLQHVRQLDGILEAKRR